MLINNNEASDNLSITPNQKAMKRQTNEWVDIKVGCLQNKTLKDRFELPLVNPILCQNWRIGLSNLTIATPLKLAFLLNFVWLLND